MVTKGTAEYDINPSGAFMPEFAYVFHSETCAY